MGSGAGGGAGSGFTAGAGTWAGGSALATGAGSAFGGAEACGAGAGAITSGPIVRAGSSARAPDGAANGAVPGAAKSITSRGGLASVYARTRRSCGSTAMCVPPFISVTETVPMCGSRVTITRLGCAGAAAM